MLRIKVERQKRGWTQQTLTFHANMPVAEVCRIETGRMRPFPAHAERLAAVLKIPAEKLLDDVEAHEDDSPARRQRAYSR